MRVPDGLRVWEKIGSLLTTHLGRGKWHARQKFRDPATNAVREYFFFGQDDCVIVLAITADGNVQVVWEFKHAVSQRYDAELNGGIIVGLPAGTPQSGAHMEPLELARARLRRETGYGDARAAARLGSFFGFTRHCPTRATGFLFMGVKKLGPPTRREGEDMVSVSVPLEEWLVMTMTDVVDGMAIATTHQAIPLLMQSGYLMPETYARACSRAVEIRQSRPATV